MRERTINGLLIEDDADDASLLMELMARSDWPSFKFAFTCAESLAAGLKLLAAGGVEVVLLDLMLPDSRGIETLLKVLDVAPDVPVVVLSGLRDEALGLKAVGHGAQDYQLKESLDGHALKRTIGYAVERHHSRASILNIIASAPDGMVVVDSQGLICYANRTAQAVLGRNAELSLGKTFPYPLPAASCWELKIPAEDGGTRVVEARATAIEWRDQPTKLISLRDMTDLRRIEQLKAEILETRKTDRLKDELISAVSHEMRSPLTVIKAAAVNLKDGLAGTPSPEQAGMLAIQYRNIVRLQRIVDHILDLSRLESGRAVIKPRRVDAGRLIREAAKGFQLLASERDVQVEQDVPGDLPPIWADSGLFAQVLGNLLDNALRFAKSRVVISAKACDLAPGETGRRLVQFSVRDDGRGIPKERIGEMFKKFVQIDPAPRTERYGGTGLGLAICKEIVERQQGRIWAESGEGQGARFHFVFPRYESMPSGGQGGDHVPDNGGTRVVDEIRI